jgi:capsular polysaccharide biosynthesis protein
MSALSDMTSDRNGVGVPMPKSAFVDPETPDEYSGPLINLSFIKQALSRRRKFWIGAALAGLVIGSAFHTFVPAKYTAVADLYLNQPAGADPIAAMQNDVSLLETRTVAAQALTSLHLNADPGTFVSTYEGIAVSGNILSIKLNASSPAQAVSYDNAVANAFLDVSARELALQTQLVVNGLKKQISTLNAAMKDLTSAINSLSTTTANSQSANQLATLVTQRTNDASQISQLQSQEQQDILAEQANVQGSSVLDPAVATKVSPKKVIVMDGLTGLIGGLGLSVGIIVIGAIISDRPRRRSDVAATLGVPIELSVGRYHPPLIFRQMRLRRSLKSPGLTMRMIARRLGAHLDAAPGSRLATIAIGPTEPAALGVATLALWLAMEGKRVVLVDMSDGRPLVHLFRAKRIPDSRQVVNFHGLWLTLIVAPEDPGEMMGELFGEDDVVLVLASVSPALGADHIASWANNAALVVTAGKASDALMASTTQLLRQSGVVPVSAVLIDAGREDDTVGVVDDEPLPPVLTTDTKPDGENVWSRRTSDLRREWQR